LVHGRTSGPEFRHGGAGGKSLSRVRKPAGISALRAMIQCGDRLGTQTGFRSTFEGVEPMGRGRAKAKQQKVARQLKYSGVGMDLDRLRADLAVGTGSRDADDHAAYADLTNRHSVDDEDDDLDDEDDDLDDEDDDLDEDEESTADAARMSRAAGG
jgi:Protein of unknown function (DUF3073)